MKNIGCGWNACIRISMMKVARTETCIKRSIETRFFFFLYNRIIQNTWWITGDHCIFGHGSLTWFNINQGEAFSLLALSELCALLQFSHFIRGGESNRNLPSLCCTANAGQREDRHCSSGSRYRSGFSGMCCWLRTQTNCIWSSHWQAASHSGNRRVITTVILLYLKPF